jgi:hypothetical protein
MLASGESQKEWIRQDFTRANLIDFLGAKISFDNGFILLREIDERLMYDEFYEKILLSDFMVVKFMEYYSTMPL